MAGNPPVDPRLQHPNPQGTWQPIKPGGGVIFENQTLPLGVQKPPEAPPEGRYGGPERRG